MQRKWVLRAGVSLAVAIAGLTAMAPAGFAKGAAPLPTAHAGNSSSNGTVLGVPGTLTVGEINASGGEDSSASYSLVSIGGMSLLGHDANNNWDGSLSGAGSLVDGLNQALCPAGNGTLTPVGDGSVFTCLLVLPSFAHADETHGDAGGAVVALKVLVDQNGSTNGGELRVLTSGANGFGCGATALAGVIQGISVVNGKEKPINIGGVKAVSPCMS